MEKYYVYAYLDESLKIEEKYCGIYFEYRPIYIGKGKNKRLYDHFNDRKRFKSMFYNKLNKMIDNSETPLVIKLKEFDIEEDALSFEKQLISEIKNIKNGGYLYNTTDGGVGCSGYKHSDETKNLMRLRSIERKYHLRFLNQNGEDHPFFGKKHNVETRRKMSIKRRLRVTTDETRKKMSESQKGKVLSEEHKDKIRISNLGKIVSEETKEKQSISKIGKPTWNKGLIKDIILQIDMEGNVVREWDSLIELEESGYQKSNVINVCVGKRKSHKGFIWIYKNNYKSEK